ncbi:MAG: peroxiredoxin [Hyphomicrobiales bacterium]
MRALAGVGETLPDVELPATTGAPVNLHRLPGDTVIFCYPWTGRPGLPNPPDWDNIPGAHGSTPQAQAYAALHVDIVKSGVKVFGLSLQSTDYQREFAKRFALPFALLSDAGEQFSKSLELPVFETGGTTYLSRLTIFASHGVIRHLRYPVTDPAGDAAAMLAWLESR